ncbi:MAG TPA: TlpA disulfide reductase family protein [Kofleriaceae bacterium]|nr:TlpA disulfide reductase family protein [Kofleriaceae bacterium]
MKPAVVLAVLASVAGAARAEVKTGDRYVELDATTATGKHFRLKDMAGKWVLFTFGASWCEPCHKELPAWDKVAPKLGGKVLFVSVNINDNIDDGKQFMTSLKLKHVFPVFLPDDKSPAIKAYDPDKMPSTFVIDPEGTVRLVQYGYKAGDEDQLVKTLSDLIARK